MRDYERLTIAIARSGVGGCGDDICRSGVERERTQTLEDDLRQIFSEHIRAAIQIPTASRRARFLISRVSTVPISAGGRQTSASRRSRRCCYCSRERRGMPEAD